MGNIVGGDAINGSWLYQEWQLVIGGNGCVEQHITTNGRRNDKFYKLSKNDLAELVKFINERLIKLPNEVGTWASDSDSGTIMVNYQGHATTVSLEGGGHSAPQEQVDLIYQVIDRLYCKFPVPHHLQELHCNEFEKKP